MDTSTFQTLDALVSRLKHLRDVKRLTWHRIAAMDEFGGSSAGLLCNVLLNAYEPKSPLARKKLNLPPLKVEVDPCPTCGDPHTVDFCTKITPAVKGRSRALKTRVRISADVTEHERQALHTLAAQHGLTWSELCQGIAEGDFFFGRYPE